MGRLSPCVSRASHWGMVIAVALTVGACSSGSNGSAPPGAVGSAAASSAGAAGGEWFTESAQASGIDFTHVNGASGKFYYPEILPPGVALLDFDNDGDLDVYLVQGHPLGVEPVDASLRGRLYRNDLE